MKKVLNYFILVYLYLCQLIFLYALYADEKNPIYIPVQTILLFTCVYEAYLLENKKKIKFIYGYLIAISKVVIAMLVLKFLIPYLPFEK